MEQFKDGPGVEGGQGRPDKKLHDDAVWFAKAMAFCLAALAVVLALAFWKNGAL